MAYDYNRDIEILCAEISTRVTKALDVTDKIPHHFSNYTQTLLDPRISEKASDSKILSEKRKARYSKIACVDKWIYGIILVCELMCCVIVILQMIYCQYGL